jgi:hypothetical protein
MLELKRPTSWVKGIACPIIARDDSIWVWRSYSNSMWLIEVDIDIIGRGPQLCGGTRRLLALT